MKKRLLSAALALAMVLTLLPATIVPAFAAADWETVDGDHAPGSNGYVDYQVSTTDTTRKNYYEQSNTDANNPTYTTVTVSLCTAANSTDGRKFGHWYWQKNKGTDAETPKYVEVQTGIIAGTGTSGQWYQSIDHYIRTNAVTSEKTINGAFTVLGAGVTNLSTYANSSLTINFANSTSSLTLSDKLTTLNISAKYEDSTASGVFAQGKVGAISINRSSTTNPTAGVPGSGSINTGLTINADNIDIASISLSGRTNTVNLTNCTVGATGIVLDGETATVQGGANNAWYGQTVTATNCTFTGPITITNSDGGGVTLNSTRGVTAVGFTGNGGSGIRVTGYSQVTGAITVTPRTKTGAYAPVYITGGSVGGVTQGIQSTDNGNSMNITVSGSTTNFGTINAQVNAVVSITDADGTSVTVDKGSLTIAGSGVDIGTPGTSSITLGNDGRTTLRMDASNSNFGGITTTKGQNLDILSWNAKRQREGGNNYGKLALTGYDGAQITGGTFASTASTDFGDAAKVQAWLKLDDLLLYATGTSVVDLYGKTELARAVSDYLATAATSGTFTALGQDVSGKKDLIIMNGKNPWAKIGYNTTTGIILPDNINGMKITKWYGVNNHDIEFDAGVEVKVPVYKVSGAAADLTLNSTGSALAAVTQITKATTAAAGAASTVVNQNVTATLTGNNIHITGAVVPNVSGTATVYVDLETDVIDELGKPVKLEGVQIDCTMKDSRLVKVEFNQLLPTSASDIDVSVINGELVLGKGTGAHYTVTANVTVSAPRLKVASETNVGDKIVVTFSGRLASLSQPEKDAYTKAITEGGSFTYGVNQAMQQAINAAQATITANSTVNSWIDNAQRTIWTRGFKSPNQAKNTNYGYVDKMAPHTGNYNSGSTDGGQIQNTFDTAYIVPYLAMNITEYDPVKGTMTATLTPSYRVDVSANSSYQPDLAYNVQTGRALALTGSMVNYPVTVKLGSAIATVFGSQVMHQDGKYAYPGTSAAWQITHLGADGTLGTVVINANPGLIEISGTVTTPAPIGTNRVPQLTQLAGCKYDTLQAAIDDTARGTSVQTEGDTFDPFGGTMDTIVIDGQYVNSGAITMTGVSRKVCVVAKGLQNVTAAAGSNVSVNKIGTQTTNGYVYTVELTQDTAAPGQNIVVASATGGSATVSANPASAGSTVTVTLSAQSGYAPNGVSVKTASGNAVSVSGSGSTYTFTMPSGSVTVTPSFKASDTRATFVPTNTYQGSAQAITGTTDGKVAQGSTVPVTVSPSSGYRTMNLTARDNNGVTASVSRSGPNSFSVTVPSGATTVTLTPSFDIDNGTPFADVKAGPWPSTEVSWIYNKGYTTGYGNSWTFAPTLQCTRWEMVTFLWKAAGYQEVNISNPFKDVSPTYPDSKGQAYKAILWAYSKGIIDANNGYFYPTNKISRADSVVILYKHAGSPRVSGTSGFKDVASNAYYAKAVTWARQKGLTNGYNGNTYFQPNYTITRQEIATFLYRAFGK